MEPLKIEAKTAKFNKKINIIYSIGESYNKLYVDKKEILRAQINACKHLFKSITEKEDVSAIETEIQELKLSLDIISYRL